MKMSLNGWYHNLASQEVSLYLHQTLNETYLGQPEVSTLARTFPVMDWYGLNIFALLVC
jgi:hypothetical protein